MNKKNMYRPTFSKRLRQVRISEPELREIKSIDKWTFNKQTNK